LELEQDRRDAVACGRVDTGKRNPAEASEAGARYGSETEKAATVKSNDPTLFSMMKPERVNGAPNPLLPRTASDPAATGCPANACVVCAVGTALPMRLVGSWRH
jgi:hypothetical protein